MVKNSPSNAQDLGSTPGGNTKIPQAAGQLSPSSGTRGPARPSEGPEQPKKGGKQRKKKAKGEFSDLATDKTAAAVGGRCRAGSWPQAPLGNAFGVCVCVHAQWLLTLCGPKDCSPPGSVRGMPQAGTLEWAAIFLTQGSNLHLLRLLHW